jgi:hypothetical protein
MLLTFLDEAQKSAARALAASRAYNVEGGVRHDTQCSEPTPCRDCDLDAYTATAAIVLTFDVCMADMEADARTRVGLEEAVMRRKVDAYLVSHLRPAV